MLKVVIKPYCGFKHAVLIMEAMTHCSLFPIAINADYFYDLLQQENLHSRPFFTKYAKTGYLSAKILKKISYPKAFIKLVNHGFLSSISSTTITILQICHLFKW